MGKILALLTASRLVGILQSWIGYSIYNVGHDKILHIYNTQKKLPRGYRVQSTDQWCATGLSSAIIKAGMVDLIGTECGCEEFVKIFKKKKIWIEDGKITPRLGDIIVYNWNDKTQPNNGWSDHIGIVEATHGNVITTIECNYRKGVNRRHIPIGWCYIRGYARPNYDAEPLVDEPSDLKTNDEIATEVIRGLWGNGSERVKRIKDAGYDYDDIQFIVNSRLATSKS